MTRTTSRSTRCRSTSTSSADHPHEGASRCGDLAADACRVHAQVRASVGSAEARPHDQQGARARGRQGEAGAVDRAADNHAAAPSLQVDDRLALRRAVASRYVPAGQGAAGVVRGHVRIRVGLEGARVDHPARQGPACAHRPRLRVEVGVVHDQRRRHVHRWHRRLVHRPWRVGPVHHRRPVQELR